MTDGVVVPEVPDTGSIAAADVSAGIDSVGDALAAPFTAASGGIQGALNGIGIRDPMMHRIAEAAMLFLGGNLVTEQLAERLPFLQENGLMENMGGLMVAAAAISHLTTGDPTALFRGAFEGVMSSPGGQEMVEQIANGQDFLAGLGTPGATG